MAIRLCIPKENNVQSESPVCFTTTLVVNAYIRKKQDRVCAHTYTGYVQVLDNPLCYRNHVYQKESALQYKLTNEFEHYHNKHIWENFHVLQSNYIQYRPTEQWGTTLQRRTDVKLEESFTCCQ